MSDSDKRNTPFFWFKPDAARAIAETIIDAGDLLERVEFHTVGDGTEAKLYAHILTKGGEPVVLNDSLICPPFCIQ